MKLEQLRSLLTQEESPTLEFKKQWYAIDSPQQQTKDAQKEEFIKDILALANGSATTAGETAYLIIGPDDKERDANGQRILHPVTEPTPSLQMLLQWVNNACDPALEQLLLERITLDGSDLFVFTIPFSPHVHETTKKITIYTKHCVFWRVQSTIEVASAREREVLLTMKQRRVAETQRVPPRFFGGVVGAIVGGVMLANVAQSYHVLGQPIVVGIVGAAIGSLFGWTQGYFVHTVRQLRRDLEKVSTLKRYLFWLLFLFVVVGIPLLIYIVNAIRQ